MNKKYRKKPVIIEAIQWTGKNLIEVSAFINNESYAEALKEYDRCFPDKLCRDVHKDIIKREGFCIETLEGNMKGKIGDYIIKGVNGEFYPCKPDIFAKTYEEVTEQLTTLMGLNISNMEDKDIMSELKLEYRNNIVYFNGLKINAYTAEGMRLISNLLKKGLYEIGKELENVSNSK